jgi:hypothetical protein
MSMVITFWTLLQKISKAVERPGQFSVSIPRLR